jgi:hypothetical protein
VTHLLSYRDTAPRIVPQKLTPYLLALALATVSACDEPPPEIIPAAGSFALPGACGGVVLAPNNDIFVWSRSSSVDFRVERRTFTGAPVWSTTLPGVTDCSGASLPSGDAIALSQTAVYVLNAATGAIRWSTIANSPRVATGSDGKLYVATNALGTSPAAVTAYDGSNGAIIWTKSVTDIGAPYLNEQLQTLYYVRRAGAVAFNSQTGAVKWEIPVTKPDHSQDAAIAPDGSLVINRENGTVSAVDALDLQGQTRWSNNVSTPRNFVSAPIIDDSATVYSASCGGLSTACFVIALSLSDGKVIWRKDFDRIESDLAVDAKQNVYVVARLTNAVPYQLYGLHKGATVSLDMAQGISPNSVHPLTLHPDKLVYYIGTDIIVYRPTAGIARLAPWPMPKHDARHSASWVMPFLPD